MFEKKSLHRVLGSLIVSSIMLTPSSGAIFTRFNSNPEKNLEVAKEKLDTTKDSLNSIMEKCENFHSNAVEVTSKLEQSIISLQKINESSKESFLAFNEWFEIGCSSKSDLYDKYLSTRENLNKNLENFKNTITDINNLTEEINNLSAKYQYPYQSYKDTILSLTKAYYNYEKASTELIK